MTSTRSRIIFALGLFLILLALVSAFGIAQRQIKLWKPRISEYASLHYGLQVEMDNLDYAFPDGVRATRLRIATLEKSLLDAEEATFRIRLMDLLWNRSVSVRILKSIDAAGLNVRLERSITGEWLVPLPPFSSRNDESAGGKSSSPPSPVLCSVRKLGVDLSTPRGSMERQYDRLDARFDPINRTASVRLQGDQEKLKIDFRREPERRVEVEADSVSLEPLLLFTSPVLPFDRLFLDGKATIREVSSGRFSFAAAGHIFGRGQDGSLKVHLDVEGSGTPAGLEEARGKMALDGQTMDFSVATVKGKRPAIQLEATFPDFSFERAVAAVPVSFRPNLSDLKVTGYLKGSFNATIATAPPYRTAYRFTGKSERLRVLALGTGIRISTVKGPFLHRFRTEQGETVAIWVGAENPDFVPYGQIPPAMIKAVMTAEDGGFFRHRGFSIQQFMEASADNIRAGRVVRGASTITMQLAKNLYLPKERTLSRKFEELFITIALEQELAKRRILEIYLNIIEWGDGIYGLGPAARHYFQKHPSELTDEECAFLASIIARPRNRWKPDPLISLSSGWRQYVDLIVRKMGEKEIPDEREP
ncbi:MAG: hypothetical protein HPY65_00905 [Syntrophaceae bacterium]|nr:hypothetical protein [Syntrophaceae bacterium]